MFFVLDPFCFRQFDPKFEGGTKILITKEKFIQEINRLFKTGQYQLIDGYAPFCKHLFVPNFSKCLQGYVKISEENENLIETAYKARRSSELPVLSRFIKKEKLKCQPEGNYLDIILYSHEQIQKENEAMNEKDANADVKYEYGVVSIKCLDRNSEVPMNPITMMRNSLGKEYGGSGVKLESKKYLESVEFWDKHVTLV